MTSVRTAKRQYFAIWSSLVVARMGMRLISKCEVKRLLTPGLDEQRHEKPDARAPSMIIALRSPPGREAEATGRPIKCSIYSLQAANSRIISAREQPESIRCVVP